MKKLFEKPLEVKTVSIGWVACSSPSELGLNMVFGTMTDSLSADAEHVQVT